MLYLVLSLVLIQPEQDLLQGRVVDHNDTPVAGAVVAIASVKPRQGVATRCPTCYEDCAQRTITAADGSFSFLNLSADNVYQLAIGRQGFEGAESDYLQPSAEQVHDIRMAASSNGAGTQLIQGQVLDRLGKPLEGAIVKPRYVRQGNRVSGNNGLVTLLTLTDSEGHFVLHAQDVVEMTTLRVQAPKTSPVEVEWSPDRETPCIARLDRGASVRGRLTEEDRPLAAVQIGIVQAERRIGNVITPVVVATDEEGFFQFDNLPPDRDYAIYTLLNQKTSAILPVSLVAVPAHGKRAQLGDVPTQTPNRLTISIATTDGTKIPEGSTVYLSRDKAWQNARLRPRQVEETTLEVQGIGNEEVQVSVRIPGYNVVRTEPRKQQDLNRRYPIRMNGDAEFKMFIQRSNN